MEGEEAWVEEGRFPQMFDLKITRYQKATSTPGSRTVDPLVPNIKVRDNQTKNI